MYYRDLSVVQKLVIASVKRIGIVVGNLLTGRRWRVVAIFVMAMMLMGSVQMNVRASGMSVRLSNRRSRMRMRHREQALAHQQEWNQD
ncbi:MAG: hypothetical protein Fues2KO_50180 [Fuerstiella sp.]